ncbi:hypothetical protein IAR50_002590 [Cryptococcus sp. DSM 104548]
MEIPSETCKSLFKEVSKGSRRSPFPNLWDTNAIDPVLLDDALWTVKDGLFMCTCKTPHDDGHYMVEDQVTKALRKGQVISHMNENELPQLLEKKRVPTVSAALAWDKCFHEDEFSWDKEGMKIRHISLDPVASCSAVELEKLDAVKTTSLRCPRKHSSSVYVCRVLTKAKVEDGIVFQVEDPHGLVLPVNVKFPTPIPCYALNLRSTLQELYPIGAILAIPEPDLRSGTKGGYVIVVHVPTDIQELHGSHPLAQAFKGVVPAAPIHELTWEEVKDLGNKALKGKNPIIAAKHYTTALKYPEVMSNPGRQLTLHLNRAQAHLDQKLYGYAYRDCAKVERLAQDPEAQATDAQLAKLYWRMANSAYAMKAKLETRKIESQYGHYNWSSIFQDVHRTKAPCIDIADYEGPVEARIIPSKKTRGLVLTRSVRAGDLLIVSKSLLTSYSGDAGNAITPCVDNSTDEYIKPSSYSAIARAVHRCLDDPFSAELFASCDSVETSNTPQPPTWQCTEAKRLEKLFKPVRSVNLKQIRRAIVRNKVHDLPIPFKAEVGPPSTTQAESREWPLMLFGLPNLISHSCRPNVSMNLWGDVAVIRSLYNMPKGTELVLNRLDTSLTYTARVELALARGFKCSCPLCRSDARTEFDLRFRLIEEVLPKLKMDFHSVITSKLEAGTSATGFAKAKEWIRIWIQMERKIMSTYADANKWMRSDLVETRKMLMAAWLLVDRGKAIEALKNSLEAKGCVWSSDEERISHGRILERLCDGDDSVVKDLCYPVKAYSRVMPIPAKNRVFISFWARTAFWAHQVYHGGDLAFFRYRFATELPHEEGLIDWEWNEDAKKNGDGIEVPPVDRHAPIDVKVLKTMQERRS